MPRREQRWREGGGERAEGGAWEAAQQTAWPSECESTHGLEGRRVHRIVLEKR